LPPKLKNHFALIVSNFILTVFENLPQDFGTALREDNRAVGDENIRNYIRQVIGPRMMSLISDMKHFMAGRSNRSTGPSDMEFPVVCGRAYAMSDPSLELVKQVCHVLSVDPSIAGATKRLHHQLLKAVHTDEFQAGSKFENPCHSYILPDIVCTFCHNTRDIDICRDPLISFGEWKCPVCSNLYDKSLMENSLVEAVQKLVVRSTVQDLRCVRCKDIKANNVMRSCGRCTSAYGLTLPNDAVDAQLSVLRDIANFHEFSYLSEILSWV